MKAMSDIYRILIWNEVDIYQIAQNSGMLLCSIVRIQHHAIRWKASQRATRRISIQITVDSLAMSRQISPASLHWLCWRTGPPARSLEKRSYWNDLEWTEQKNILVFAECFTLWVLRIPLLSTALKLIKQQQVPVFEVQPIFVHLVTWNK